MKNQIKQVSITQPASRRISKDQLEELIALYKEEFGETLSMGDAALRAQQLIALYECLFGVDGEGNPNQKLV